MTARDTLRFTIEGSFCSFRDPRGAKYQQTFWFPPKTTVVGFLGAALGLAPPDLESLYDQVQVGVVLRSWGGLARDLWGYTKLKQHDKPETAVVVRELIYEPQYTVWVASNEGFLKRLEAALWDPVYPLRFGRGEDLALIRQRPELVALQMLSRPRMLYWTLLPFTLDQRPCVLESPDREPPPRMPPRPARMPVRFTYKKPDWVREADPERDFRWVTQVFDWGVQPDTTEGLWTDGEYAFYLI